MESKLNNCLLTLQPAESFIGQDEVCDGSTIIAISIIANKNCTIVVKQTNNRTRYPFVQEVIHLGTNLEGRYQVYTNAFYCHVEVTNTSVDPVDIVVSTRFLDIGKDFSASDPLPIVGDVVVSSIVAPLPAGTNSIGSVVISSSYSDIVIAGVANEGGLSQSISVETEVRPPTNQTIYKLETYDYTANNTLTSIDSKVGLQGQNTDFAFFPDATNLTPAIYADGEQPIATNQAGWVYSNSGNPPNKINWYIYQDVTLPQYLVSEMDSIYFVISQITPATTLPFVSFYTMPNGIDDVVPNFAKSKLVFAPSGAVPTAQGEYLFYVKSDPTHIRPEITNRYELTFVADQSTKTLAQAAGERLSLSTLSTSSSDAAGANYFLFQQYGITWEKTSVPLPVNNGLLDCNIVSTAPVSLSAGTADIGYVRLTAENLASNPSTFSNLQMVGANLQVEDQQAITTLTSIDGLTNSINISTTSIASSSTTIESRLTTMDTKMITLSNGASTKTLTQTGANWTAGSSTLQSLTISNVGGLVFSYVKLYNKATAPDQNDTPVMTLPLNHETVQQVVCNSLLFNLGIGVRATNAFVANDNTAPSGTVYATAFYKLG
jgi:hypothetical protein